MEPWSSKEVARLTRDSASFSTCVNATFKGILPPAWRHLVHSWERLSNRAKRMHYYAMCVSIHSVEALLQVISSRLHGR